MKQKRTKYFALGRALAVVLIFSLLIVPLSGIPAYADGYDDYSIYLNGRSTGYVGYCTKGNVYLPTTMIGTYCSNNGVTVDTTNKKLVIDMHQQNIMLADDTVTNFVKANVDSITIPLKTLNNHLCFSINAMSQFFKLDYSVSGRTIKLKSLSGSDTIAKVNRDNVVAVPALSSETDEKLFLNTGERVYITGETQNYYIISSFDEDNYYVMKSAITKENIDLSKIDFYASKKTKNLPKNGQQINLAWLNIGENGVTPTAPDKYSGLDVIAPTWFRLKVEGGGSISSSGDRGFSDLAHASGYQVWATITNNMTASGSTNFTGKMFDNPSIEDKAIAEYILYSCIYDVDGINIDFEDLKDSYRDGFTAFTQKMRKYTERQGLVLSVDTLIPESWTVEYDMAALSSTVDYLAIMTYDEHYSGSKTPGSIASLPWVERAVKNSLDMGVPANKLLMGMPFYTRIWVVDSSGSIVKKSAVTMNYIKSSLYINNPTITYLEYEQQNYAEYQTDSGTAKIWLEDASSVQKRLDLIDKYNLAGAACWEFTQATPEIWTLFE